MGTRTLAPSRSVVQPARSIPVLARGDGWPRLGFLGFPQWENHPSPSPSSSPLSTAGQPVPRAGFATLFHELVIFAMPWGQTVPWGVHLNTEQNFSQGGGIQAVLAKKNWCGEIPDLGRTRICSRWALSLTPTCLELVSTPLQSASIGVGIVQRVSRDALRLRSPRAT